MILEMQWGGLVEVKPGQNQDSTCPLAECSAAGREAGAGDGDGHVHSAFRHVRVDPLQVSIAVVMGMSFGKNYSSAIAVSAGSLSSKAVFSSIYPAPHPTSVLWVPPTALRRLSRLLCGP